VDRRARLDKAFQIRKEAALDPYAFTREAYRQRRTYLIYDGHPPRPKLEDDEEPPPVNRDQ
jgi:phospholipid-binding lipoprotein MlaA